MMPTFLAAKHIPRTWWKSAVVSFLDTNGDGIGDIPGLISKLDYLKNLGVDVIWISPIFKSPQVDNGYDVEDYRDIAARYGTLADVDELIAQMHRRGMKLLLDLVVNHTSDQHVWFKESRSSKSSPKRDWYIWRPAKYDADGSRREPNNWQAAFGGSAWQWDERTKEYYLHLFDPAQPDLNWEREDMRREIYDMMNWWMDKGCDGYRMDVIGRISKDQSFPDAPVTDPDGKYQDFPRVEGPRLHEFLQELNHETLSSALTRGWADAEYDVMTVGELNKITPEGMLRYVHPDRHEINLGFCFDHVNVGLGEFGIGRHIVGPWKISELKAAFSRWQAMRDYGAHHPLYLENHDQSRSISRFASDSPQWRWESGRLLALLHCTLFGTVFIFQGQEIGMVNLPSDWPHDEFKDVQTQNVLREIAKRGVDVERLQKKVLFKARDNARSPMQWDAGKYAGFSSVKPWMRVNDDWEECNVAAQEGDAKSLLSFWRDLISWRKAHEDVLVYGAFRDIDPTDERVFAYVRTGDKEDKTRLLVLLNMTNSEVEYTVPEKFGAGKLVKSTTDGFSSTLGEVVKFAPYSGAVYDISK
ncbi:hypothetical protein CcaverHIS631_0309420 [Cutaneotrichosporon cavernicola]|nr:hypothetical protein CcaverHIS631_0309420 [Cutaneotrichosporon cavernicola]